MTFLPGMLVEINGLQDKAQPVPQAGPGAVAVDLNGLKAQLLQYEQSARKWIAATFRGHMVTVDEKYIRPLGPAELTGYDFVMGPKSDFQISGQAITEVIAAKGYAQVKLLVSEEDAGEIVAAAKRLDDEDQFGRLAVEFERGYLGIDGSAKTVHLSMGASDCPDFVKQSPLKTMDDNFGHLCSMLGSHSEAALGFELYSRTDVLLRLPLGEGDEDKYPPADLDDGDAEGYLHLMHRRKITVLQFVGPSGGTIRLVSYKDPDEVLELQAEPHTFLILLNSRYDYSFIPAGPDALVLQSFFLAEPAVYSLEEVTGNIDALLGIGNSGPPPPPGEQCTVESMYCRYGTGADGRDAYWSGCGKAATDGITEIPFVRWDHGPYYDPDSLFGGSYTRHGCFGIEGVDLFDCKFFEISPAEAKGMDPCQRQVMEVSYMALLEGGYDKRSLQREAQNIGHFVGIDKDDWMCMSAAGMLNLSGAHGAAAAANAITSNRFSYSMNLKGASMTIDTACSSSLVCTHVSKLHLRFKDFEPMPASIVNGLNLMLFSGPFIGCCAAGMLSHEGRCFTFNSTADGYCRGELCGALCFKLKQFDPNTGSLACLAGSQSNQDGRSASLTAPNGPAQEKCIKAVLRECALTPTEVDCIECHGTGTSLGDPIEVGSFRKVMSITPRKEPLVITSSKSNVAHGEGGAGLAGFFKCCLQVNHCEGASNVHLKVKNPHLDLEGFPCQILSETVVYREESSYAGVSSFGFGGTNAHAEAWGKNIMTSRGSSGIDPVRMFEKKLAQAPPAEITMNGDDVRDWETTGLDPAGRIGDKYTIELDEDGVATWEKVDDELADYGDDFFIRGTHTGWDTEPLDRHETIPGLWTTTVKLGGNGQEMFQIVADADDEKVYYPNQHRCTLKAAPIHGPGKADREKCWLILGSPGEIFKVEFFQQERRRSVIWMRTDER